MVTYDFRCFKCGDIREILVRKSSDMVTCVKCQIPMNRMFSAPAVLNTTRGKDIVDKGLGKTFSTVGERAKYLKAHGYEDGHTAPPQFKRPKKQWSKAETDRLVNEMKKHGEL